MFLCPVCQAEDSIDTSKCTECGNSIKISSSVIQSVAGSWTLRAYMKWVQNSLLPEQAEQILKSRLQNLPLNVAVLPIRISLMAVLRQGLTSSQYIGFAHLFRRHLYLPKNRQKGILLIYEDYFSFISQEQVIEFKMEDLTCVTTNGHYFEFKIRKEPFFQINFLHESPLKYEILFQKLLRRFYHLQKKQIFEFQPRLRFQKPSLPAASPEIIPEKTMTPGVFQELLRWILLFKLRILLRFFIRVKVVHADLIPKSYPFIMLLNHQSIFDPFIILAFLDKRIGFLTKSTSFSNGLIRWFLRLGKAIPTTRFETDPAVIRHIQKYLECGIPVGIFPEGERCWEGEMLAIKWSVVRLLYQTRVPIVPVIMGNTFAFMPRWDHKPHRQKISLEVGAPFCLSHQNSDILEIKEWLEAHFQNILNLNKENPVTWKN